MVEQGRRLGGWGVGGGKERAAVDEEVVRVVRVDARNARAFRFAAALTVNSLLNIAVQRSTQTPQNEGFTSTKMSAPQSCVEH